MNRIGALPCLLGVFLAFTLPGCSTAPENDVAPAAPKPAEVKGLTAEILPGSGIYAPRGVYSVIIHFRNEGEEPVSILKPLTLANWKLHMPYYRLTALDAKGKPLEESGYCGTWQLPTNTQWPQDYIVEIKPGKSYDVELALPFEVKHDGRYTLTFEYVYQPVNEAFAPPAEAWRGTLKTPPSSVYLRLDGAPAQ